MQGDRERQIHGITESHETEKKRQEGEEKEKERKIQNKETLSNKREERAKL